MGSISIRCSNANARATGSSRYSAPSWGCILVLPSMATLCSRTGHLHHCSLLRPSTPLVVVAPRSALLLLPLHYCRCTSGGQGHPQAIHHLLPYCLTPRNIASVGCMCCRPLPRTLSRRCCCCCCFCGFIEGQVTCRTSHMHVAPADGAVATHALNLSVRGRLRA